MGGDSGELVWQLQGWDRSVLVAANLLFVGLIVATVTSLARKTGAARKTEYQELGEAGAQVEAA